jgi:hypothetical protein
MKHETILKAWYDYCRKVLPDEWTVTFAEEVTGKDAPRPQKPYLTLKIISGPGLVTMDDQVINCKGDAFSLVGQRKYTISVKAFGSGHIDALNDLSTLLDAPGYWDQLKEDADIAVTNKGEVTDVSGLLETGYERRASLDIFFNSSNNKTIDIGPIESVKVDGSLDSGNKEINTNIPIITKE